MFERKAWRMWSVALWCGWVAVAGCDATNRVAPFPDEGARNDAPGSLTTLDNEPAVALVDTDDLVDDTDVPVVPGFDDNEIIAMSSGDAFSCALFGDGGIRCWGRDDLGQASPPAGAYIDLAVGDEHGCAITQEQGIRCWGSNTGGRATPPGGLFRRVVSGPSGSCALDEDGGVTCWGAGVTVPADIVPLASLSLGDQHACGLSRTGSEVVCWGSSQIVAGAPTTGTFRAVVSGRSHACTLDTSGVASCWGANNAGQLDVPGAASTLSAIYAGHDSTCATDDGGSLVCWGGVSGQPEGTYTLVGPGEDHGCGVIESEIISCWGSGEELQTVGVLDSGVAQVVVGASGHVCWLDDRGGVACAGADDFGQASPPAGVFVALEAGDQHTCAVTADNRVQCWGDNSATQTDVPNVTFAAVAGGRRHTCGIRTADGAADCWGGGFVDWQPLVGPFDDVDAGAFHTCGLLDGGEITCWGANGDGQRNVPSGALFSGVSAGAFHTCGIAGRTGSGAVLCWGANDFGQSTPTAATFVRISAGDQHTCGVQDDGELACWGADDLGRLDAPAGSFNGVSVGKNFACALGSAGELRCWGAVKL